MKVLIQMLEDRKNIYTERDFRDINDRGEVAHFICELESIKSDLLEIWENMEKDDTISD